MPSRVLRDYTDSLRFDGITADAERLFVRLIMKADDYGRYHAEPRLVRAGCFPLSETLRTNDLSRWLDELSTRQLIFRYETQGRHLLAIIDFRQRLKLSRAKFPAPEGKPENYQPGLKEFPPVPGTSGKFPPDSDLVLDSEKSPPGRAGAPKSKAEVIAEAERFMPTSSVRDKPDAGFIDWWWDEQEKRGWTDPQSGLPWHDWRAAFTGAWRGCSHRATEQKSKTYGPNQKPPPGRNVGHNANVSYANRPQRPAPGPNGET